MPTVGVFAAIIDDREHILCVKHDYGDKHWALPGGGMESGESPSEALKREVEEETGYIVRPNDQIGVYSARFKDDIVIFFRAEIEERLPWQPNEEISEVQFFDRHSLPESLRPRTRARISDAFEGRNGVYRVYETDE